MLEHGVAVGAIAGQPCSSVTGIERSPSAPRTVTVASSAARATAMSEGWVASSARVAEHREVAVLTRARGAPGPRPALVARLGDVLEVDAAGALHEVAPDCGQVAQLAGGAVEDG
jgi:hypothetical protein